MCFRLAKLFAKMCSDKKILKIRYGRGDLDRMLAIADETKKEIIILGDFNVNILVKQEYKPLATIMSRYHLKQLRPSSNVKLFMCRIK